MKSSESHHANVSNPVSGTSSRKLFSKAALMALGAATWMNAVHALTINVIYDSTVQNDAANYANIQTAVNNMVSVYEGAFSNNLTLTLTIHEDSTTGGASNSPAYTSVSYAAYRSALQSHAITLDNLSVITNMGPTSPVGTTGQVGLAYGNAAALGFTAPTNPDGSIATNLTIGTGGATSVASLTQKVMHEMDEQMGTVSGAGGSKPNAIDFTRYTGTGQRSFTPDRSTTSYFSVDGAHIGPAYSSAGDYADFASNSYVQGPVGSQTNITVERRMLNTGGWNYAGPVISNDYQAGVLNTFALAAVSTAGGVIADNGGNSDVHITEGGGSGTLTLGSATTTVNTLVNTATATAATVNLAGKKLVVGNGALDAGVGLIEIGESTTLTADGVTTTTAAGTSLTTVSYTHLRAHET